MARSWDEVRAEMAEEARQLREVSANPERPLMGSLAGTNADTGCDWCRARHPDDEDAGYIEATGASPWVVLGAQGGTYHVACARELGWTPSPKEADYLERFPIGPYA